ncbi:MAG: xanthine dehydrogenase family protein molybdopterin-binding subunit [Bacteroidales bacterium]|nr:xanthine dehydrogenase family protein molybdopterin-binding subunit [Bacteroidales bacterium]
MGKTISSSIPRLDADKKISGQSEYIADMVMDDFVHARTVRSEKARAEIKAIHLPELPEGYTVIDKSDIPGNNRMQTVVSDHPLFAENEVHYIGQPILIITGPSKEKTVELVEKVKIDYEELPAVTDMEGALAKKEIHVNYQYAKGNPDAVFDNASKTITDEYRTGQPEHLYLETNGVIATYHNNRITIYGSIQCPFFVKNAVVEATGFAPEQIQVIQTVTGGAFGGKEEYPSLLAAQAAVASLKTGKPVRLILDRKEDIEATTKRHPSLLKYKASLNNKNEITGIDIDITFDGGAFATISPVVLQRAMFTSTGVYGFPNIRVTGRVVKTNKAPSGAFRGFGAPQVLFGIEQFMNRLASEEGVSSLAFKRQYLLKKGDTTSTGGKMWADVKIREVVDKITGMSKYEQKKKNPGKNRGIGISLFLHGCGFTGKGEVDISGEVILKKRGNKVSIFTSNVEMGQGASTTLIKIVAHSLSIPEKDVDFVKQDTDAVPDSGPTVASRTAMIIGGLVKKACNKLLDKWEQKEAEVKEVYKHPEYVTWDNDTFQGDAYPVYSWGANVAEVEADPVTCEVEVKKLWGVYDIGVALDEDIIRGQMQGGMVQGLGYAYLEKLTNRKGKFDQLNLTDYTIPTSVDVPEIECDFVENPYEFGPYGAKCAGELPLSGVAPAMAEAVEQALGMEVRNIPMTPEYLKARKNED